MGLRRAGAAGSAVPPGPTGVLRSTRPAPLVRGAGSVTGEPAHLRDHRADRDRRGRVPTDRTTGDDLPLLGPEPAVAVGLVVRQRLRPAGNRDRDRVDQIQFVGEPVFHSPGAGYAWLTTDSVRSPTGRPWSSAAPASMTATRPGPPGRSATATQTPIPPPPRRREPAQGVPVNAVQSTFPRWIGPDRNSARSQSGPAGRPETVPSPGRAETLAGLLRGRGSRSGTPMGPSKLASPAWPLPGMTSQRPVRHLAPKLV